MSAVLSPVGTRRARGGRTSSGRNPPARAIAIAAVVVTAAAVAVWASASAPLPSRRAAQSELTYLGEIQPQLDEEMQLAGVVANVRSTATTMSRQQLVTDLVELDETAASTAQALRAEGPVGNLPVHSRDLQAAADQWASGSRLLEVGSLASTGSGVTEPATGPGAKVPAEESTLLWEQVSQVTAANQAISTLQTAASDFEDGDVDFARFVTSLPASKRFRSSIPDIAWVTDTGLWSGTTLAVFSRDLADAPGLEPVSEVGLTLASVDPQPISPTAGAGVPTIVGSGPISVSAVVDNAGNVELDRVTVTVTITATGPAPGGSSPEAQVAAAPVQRTRTVALQPGQNESVVFSGCHVPAGDTYQMVVTVQAPGASPAGTTSLTQAFAVEP